MQLNAHVDVDLVAVEQPDEITVLLEIRAPEAQTDTPRPPAAVQVVLDRSGSMTGERLDAAKRALSALVDRLDPTDHFGVVAFDDIAHVVVPATPVQDKPQLKQAIATIGPGGMTNLSGGLMRGLQEAKRVVTDAGGTLLLLSDGHANEGVVDPDQLGAVAAHARAHGITTSTIGIGLEYDETLLAALAQGGHGGHAFALDGDAAAAAVAGEVEGLLSKTVQAASLTIRPAGDVAAITVWNDLPSHGIEGGVVAELGDLWAGEERKLLLTLAVPAVAALGLAQVATLELTYVAVPDLVEQTITLPIHVNVVPGDQAAGRIPDPKVHSELLFQRSQQAKRRAAEALARGDAAAARAEYQSAVAYLASAAPDDAELAQEAQILSDLDEHVAAGEASFASKLSRMEHARKTRLRGRGDGSV
jgi:Ca-activated chloride channel homolog